MFNLSSISKIVLTIPKNAGPVLALFLPTWYCKGGGGFCFLGKIKPSYWLAIWRVYIVFFFSKA